VLVIGVTEDSSISLATPTATGLTLAALGTAQATGSSCWLHMWEATAASGGSSAVSAAAVGGASTSMRALQAFAFGNCTGFVRTSGATLTGTQAVSVTRTQANSFVAFASGDWSASGTAGLAWTPAGQTQLQAATTANAALFCAYWGDQGSTGTTSYGTTGLAGTKFTLAAVEILGTVGGATFIARHQSSSARPSTAATPTEERSCQHVHRLQRRHADDGRADPGDDRHGDQDAAADRHPVHL
jgi:hypothetical protein